MRLGYVAPYLTKFVDSFEVASFTGPITSLFNLKACEAFPQSRTIKPKRFASKSLLLSDFLFNFKIFTF